MGVIGTFNGRDAARTGRRNAEPDQHPRPPSAEIFERESSQTTIVFVNGAAKLEKVNGGLSRVVSVLKAWRDLEQR